MPTKNTQPKQSFIKPKAVKVAVNPLTDDELELLDASLDQLLASMSEADAERVYPYRLMRLMACLPHSP